MSASRGESLQTWLSPGLHIEHMHICTSGVYCLVGVFMSACHLPPTGIEPRAQVPVQLVAGGGINYLNSFHVFEHVCDEK